MYDLYSVRYRIYSIEGMNKRVDVVVVVCMVYGEIFKHPNRIGPETKRGNHLSNSNVKTFYPNNYFSLPFVCMHTILAVIKMHLPLRIPK